MWGSPLSLGVRSVSSMGRELLGCAVTVDPNHVTDNRDFFEVFLGDVDGLHRGVGGLETDAVALGIKALYGGSFSMRTTTISPGSACGFLETKM